MICDLLLNGNIPTHLTVICHPFRIVADFFLCNLYISCHLCFSTSTVSNFQIQQPVHRNSHLDPRKKTVQLPLLFAPKSCIYHTIRRTFVRLFWPQARSIPVPAAVEPELGCTKNIRYSMFSTTPFLYDRH